jgi:hypothetical protein
MVNVRINIKGDKELHAKLQRVRAYGEKHVGQACLVWGQAIAIEDRKRARAKGGRSFWRDQARRIRAQRHGHDGAAVLVGIEGLHHHEGGDIFPSAAKALTIPIAPEAKGKRAAEFELGGRDLFVLPSHLTDTIGVLGYAEDDGVFHALFVLRSKVHHDPAPWLVEADQALRIGHAELDRFAAKLAAA